MLALFTDALDVNIYGAFVAMGIQAPDLIHQLTACEDLPLVGEQLEQQIELLFGQCDDLAAAGNSQGIVIQPALADDELMARQGMYAELYNSQFVTA